MTRFTENERVALTGAMPAGTARTSVAGRVARLARMTRQALSHSLRRRAIRRELRELDDRSLADIGVNRWDIEKIADKAAGKPAPSASALAREFAGLARAALVDPVRAKLREGQTYRDLMALDDHALMDIGITRGQIPAIVEGLRDGRTEAFSSADLIRPIRVWNRSRIAAKELSAFDDRTLDDIGMVRGDIDEVASALAKRATRPADSRKTSRAA